MPRLRTSTAAMRHKQHFAARETPITAIGNSVQRAALRKASAACRSDRNFVRGGGGGGGGAIAFFSYSGIPLARLFSEHFASQLRVIS